METYTLLHHCAFLDERDKIQERFHALVIETSTRHVRVLIKPHKRVFLVLTTFVHKTSSKYATSNKISLHGNPSGRNAQPSSLFLSWKRCPHHQEQFLFIDCQKSNHARICNTDRACIKYENLHKIYIVLKWNFLTYHEQIVLSSPQPSFYSWQDTRASIKHNVWRRENSVLK